MSDRPSTRSTPPVLGPLGSWLRASRRAPAARRELRELVVLARRIVLAAAVTGVVVGAVVGGYDRLVDGVALEALLEAPLALQLVAPLVGLVGSALALRWIGRGASPSTADEYLRAFHGHDVRFDGRSFLARMTASAATLGSGGALGFEGPAIYAGAGIGHVLGTRVRALLAREDVGLLLVAGAAAGVSAIFRAPATGAVFALEVPFRNDLARRSLLLALVGAASGYLTFVAINGTSTLIPISGAQEIVGRDLLGAALVGVTCWAGARAFAWVVTSAKALRARGRSPMVVVGASVVLAGLVAASHAAFEGEALSLGPGYAAVQWALEPERGILLVVALATIRVAATATTIAGGGTGGLFVPLVVQGALTGRVVGDLVATSNAALYPVLGIAAFLGAGYRVPLAAVMFVAEATGRPGFVVPGLLAAVLGQLVGGGGSVTPFQRDERLGDLERRFGLPLTAALLPDPATASPSHTVAELFTEHIALARRRAIPVVDDDGSYRGMVLLDDVLGVDHDDWPETRVADIMHTATTNLAPDDDVGTALAALARQDAHHLAVVDANGRLLGIVSRESIVDLDELLDRLEHDQGAS